MIEIVCVLIVDLPVYLIDCRVKNMNTYQTKLVYIVLIFFSFISPILYVYPVSLLYYLHCNCKTKVWYVCII